MSFIMILLGSGPTDFASRSIKYVERECPESLTQFKKLIGKISRFGIHSLLIAIGCELSVAAQFWKRLEHEGKINVLFSRLTLHSSWQGFITCSTRPDDYEQDDCDMGRKKIKARGKKSSTRPRYRKVPSAFKDDKYQDYFSPGSTSENDFIGLVWMVCIQVRVDTCGDSLHTSLAPYAPHCQQEHCS